MCPFCPDVALDSMGHHAVTCRHRLVHLGVSVEKGHGLTRNHSHSRLADVLIHVAAFVGQGQQACSI